MDYKELKEQKILLKQIKNLTTIVEQLKLNPLLSINGEQNFEIVGDLQFSEKEIRKMPRLKDFKIRIMKNKYYEIRFRRYGYDVSFSSKDFEKAKQKAFAWLSTFEEQIKANYNFTVLSRSESEKFSANKYLTFKSFADEYIYKIKKNRVKQSTFNSYRINYENNILPVYGKMCLSDIKPYFIQTHLDKVNKKTPRACEDVKMLLNNIFDYAVANGVLERNPIKAVYIPKHERKNGEAFTPEQEKNFITQIKGSKYENYFLKMLYSGVRPSEVFEISEDIEKNVLVIKNSKLKSYQKEKYRTIPIFPKYSSTLNSPIKEKASLEQLRLEFKNYCPNNTLKDLRHTFTSRARECGIDNELVAIWTGHSLGNITASVYTHFSMEHQQKQAKKLNYQ